MYEQKIVHTNYFLRFHVPNGARYPMPDATFLKISGAKLEKVLQTTTTHC